MPKLIFSEEQQAAINWIKKNDEGNLYLKSAAGVGKSQVLFEMGHQVIRKNYGFRFDRKTLVTVVTFNKKTAIQNQALFPDKFQVRTYHSLLGEILFKYIKAKFKPQYKFKKYKGEWTVQRVDDNKFKKVIWRCIEKELGVSFEDNTISGNNAKRFFATVNTVESIVNMIQMNGITYTDTEAIKDGCKKFNIVVNNSDINTAMFCISKGIEILETHGIYSNNEVVHLLSSHYPFDELQRHARLTEKLFFDECQDAPLAVHKALKLITHEKTQVILCGDEYQSLYVWNFISPYSYSEAINFWNAQGLPLSRTYRCPTCHVDLIHELGINFDIQSLEDYKDGELRSCDYQDFLDEVKPGALVLSRNLVGTNLRYTGPQIAADLLLRGKPVFLSRWSVVSSLEDLMRPLRKKVVPSLAWFQKYLDKYEARELDKENEKKIPSKKVLKQISQSVEIASLFFQCFQKLHDTNRVRVEKFMDFLTDLETDKEGAIRLSSVHGAKGVSYECVYIFNWSELSPEKILENGCSDLDAQCEFNVRYVQLSRSSKEMVWVGEPVPETHVTKEELLAMHNPDLLTNDSDLTSDD